MRVEASFVSSASHRHEPRTCGWGLIIFWPLCDWCFDCCFYLVRSKKIESHATITIVCSALFIFCLTNPFLLLNSLSASAELDSLVGWYQIEFKFENVVYFLKNSLVHGFGIGFIACFLLALVMVARGKAQVKALMFLAFSTVVIFAISTLTSSMSNWQTNYRYCTYLLPLFIYFVASYGDQIKLNF